ncbi:MAG: S-layer family protein, partial [Moorea sp. SIO4A3]|nr:S-layer family protein [Moorena sp. SIO4A3]
IDFISSAITLSNGTVVDINGQAEPTLDVRAGVDPTEVGIPGLTGNQFFGDLFNLNLFGRPTITNTATSADITIGTIAFANVSIFDFNISPNDLLAGKVLLTNQYKPNPSLAGDIEVSATLGSLVPTLENVAIQNGELSKGGSVTIDSRGSITLNGIVNTIAIPSKKQSNSFIGNGGDVTFLADNNITLKPGSLIVSAGIVGGTITLKSDSNFLLDDAGVLTATTGAGVGGNLIVNASESVTLINRQGSGFNNLVKLLNSLSNSDNKTNSESLERILEEVLNGSGLASITSGPGDAGDLTINTGTLSIQNQAQNQESENSQVGATTAIRRDFTPNTGATTATTRDSSGNSGHLTVYAESVEIVGNETGPFTPTPNEELASAIREIFTGLTTATEGTGKGGDLTINTQRLTLKDGAGVAAGTVATSLEKAGAGGNLSINATESVTLSGKATLATGTLNSGDAGKLEVNTPKLTLEKGAVIAADTTGSGNAGDLTIKTEQLLVRDGSRIGAATGNSGTGADITVMASDLVELVGTAVDDQNNVVPSGIFANSQFINDARNKLGNAGSIKIDTEKLIVRDGAKIAVNSQGDGKGGNIELQAGTLTLDNQAELSAETASTQGGDITLTIAEFLFLRRKSKISTTAGTAQAGGDGGNITIDAPFILGVRQEDSDITANAFEGDGGNITINTQGIIGLEFREKLTPLSDITASSEFGVDGTVNINAPEIDPSQGLSELPTDVIDRSKLIERNLCAAGEGTEFTATGSGGLPISPKETLSPNATWDDSRITEQPQTRIRKDRSRSTQDQQPQTRITKRRLRSRQHQIQINQPQTKNPKPKQIVEAQGWVMGANGKVILTAHPVIVTPKGTWLHQVDCQRLQETLKRLR